ncbi:hypothetical protein Pedsa_1292 [Pseudopedobacter saltans DSM 12145]|uniref:DUF393 domain-containing protein n=1 Tax=Pseudopedobacter saltans (strain ATCC 51119 / DSM 12145 / JCM 21818 / CCUG 39354 / LMG 10337 / NBRC 100064 / NCIMB 13643) TaxID=762903 RepID=F0SDW3_PSESL|nr:DCC1-like thiol-disulfide oxidoreductase family protein [Pseudopedobacter saltans]ADY51859.1 hypothetical protein Pedsa_1292 [Pseudopedobacter saltans DSM 12145]
MKTLKNHLILFDAECPMCRLYTQTFVDSGMLDKDGRTAYQDVSEQMCPMLDRQRAVNEIALINQETGEVTYGVESLFKVFATSYPFFKGLFTFKPFVWIMKKCYAFISFNRRVIVPAAVEANAYQLQPAFKLKYRVAYLLVTWILTAAILTAYVPLLNELLPKGGTYREYLICGIQLIFQGFVINGIDSNKFWAYLGNMMTISFVGALLLLPALLIAQFVSIAPIFYMLWFMGIVGLMLLEHMRRCKILQLGWLPTATWILYRVLVLLFIFNQLI